MKALSQVLTDAAALIAGGWAQPCTKTADGILCDSSDPACAQWDIHGALFRAAENDPNLICDALNLLDGQAPGGSAQLWEEASNRTQNDVVRLMRRAADRAWRAEKEEAA